MALFRKFFYRKPPDGLLEISERVYVFDCCFTMDGMEDNEFKVYMGSIVAQFRDHFSDASFMVFNFREGDHQSQISNILSEYDMTVMDYPRHYESCPILTMEMIHHFLRSSESWLSLGQQNIILVHCERGGWPILAFMLSALLIYRKQYTGEQKTLDMIYKQAPRELLQLMSPLNPLPSQLRYLQYVSRRNVGSEWPPLDRALTLDCIIMRMIPNLDSEGGCRPIFRIYGQDPFMAADRTPKVLFSTPKKCKTVRHFKQAECELVKIDIHCHIQGDVVLECISLHDDLEREEMMFRVMFNTAFIRSNILMLNRDEIDILWDAKDQFPKDFRAEVLCSEMDAAASLIALELPGLEEKEGLPIEAFAKVQEIFSNVDWLDPKKDVDVALNVLQQITGSKIIIEKVEGDSPSISEIGIVLQESENNSDTPTYIARRQSFPALEDANLNGRKFECQELHAAMQWPNQSKIISSHTHRTSRSNPVSCSNFLQGSPVPISRYHSAPSLLGITALLQDHAAFNAEDFTHVVTKSPPSPAISTPVSNLHQIIKPPMVEKDALEALTSTVALVGTSPQTVDQHPGLPLAHDNFHPSIVSPPPLPIHFYPGESPSLLPPPLPLPLPPPPPPPLPPPSSSLSDASLAAKSSISTLPPTPPPPPSRGPFALSSMKNSSPVPPPPPPPSPPERASIVTQSVSSPVSMVSSSTVGPPPPSPPTRSGPASDPVVPSVVPPPPPAPGFVHKSPVAMNSPRAPPPPPPPALAPKTPVAMNTPHAPPPPPAPFGNGLLKSGDASPQSHSSVSNGNVPPIPAPPFSAKGRLQPRTAPRNQSQTKKSNLKPYHWLKLTRAMQGSLWAETQKSDEASKAPEFDMSELESLFSAAAPKSDIGSTGGKSRSPGPKVDKVQLIELRRAYNCEIMLSKVKVPLPDLMNSVLALDDSALDIDQLDNLIKFCPTKEEMDQLKGYNGDKENLGKCEQFFLELMKVPRVESKLRVFSFKIQFRTQVSDLRKSLNIVNSASEEIRNSVKLKRIMQTILSLGNALNHGTARGSAIGFRLDSLLKLTDTRARNKKMTLMHYLCKVLAEKLPELLDFSKDLLNLETATKIQLKYLAEEMQAISKGLEKVVQELTASENDGPVSEIFCKTLKQFLGFAESEVRSLAFLYSGVGRNADALALYFGEDPARCPFEQVVTTLLNFVRMFVRAHEENGKHLELEKKKAQKEAENEKMKSGTPKMGSQHLTVFQKKKLESDCFKPTPIENGNAT